jgi:cobalt-zinc-cadmium efflux system outer membrane protein
MHPFIQRLPPILLLLCSASAGAQHQHVEHEHLETDPALQFTEILDQAVLHVPQALSGAAREEMAADYTAYGKSWLAGRPSLNLSYINDRPRSNQGLQEQDYSLQLPLWRLGEKANAVRLGELYQDQAGVWKDWFRWEVAGNLKMMLADIETAEVVMALEQAAQSRAEELHDVTQRMFEAGEVSRLDVMQTETLALEHLKNVLEAEAGMVDAEREYNIYTGLDTRPETGHREELTTLEEPVENHPLLLLMASQVSVADAGIRQSEISAKGNPQLTIGTRRERPDQFQPYINSVGITLNIPIGGKSIVAARTSSARMQKTDAEVDLLNARRLLERDIHEAEHGLFVTRESLPLSRQRYALATQNTQLARSAFEAGELTLAQVIVVMQQEIESERELRMLELQEQRQITEYNHLIGVMP